jgi:transcriptional regulator with XRE-family HTH domain
MPTPTTRRKQLGNELRHLRERAGLELTDAAKVIERSWSVVSKLENGITGIRQGDLRRLVELYRETIGADEEGAPADGGEPIDPDEFAELNRGAENRGRWRGHRSTYPSWFRAAVDFEQDASAINIFETELVHGLFQTEAYMRALFVSPVDEPDTKQINSLVKARLERQQVLTRPGLRLTLILSESCLRRVVGSNDVMLAQLLHLAEMATRTNITIHVLPFSSPVVSAYNFPFVFYRIPSVSKNTPPLETVFVEQFTTGDYFDELDSINAYSELWTELLGAASDPIESRELMLQIAQDYQ